VLFSFAAGIGEPDLKPGEGDVDLILLSQRDICAQFFQVSAHASSNEPTLFFNP
jgi:hypothetical protein